MPVSDTPRTLLDVGSDSLNYRTHTQSYISELYSFLQQKDISLTTLDSDPDAQPDIVHDITQPLEGAGTYNAVIAANILEHIPTDRLAQAIDNIVRLVTKGGLVVVTVPFNLPRHNRPIDSMLRPTPGELSALMGHTPLLTEQWEDKHYREPYLSSPSLAPAPIVTGGIFRK